MRNSSPTPRSAFRIPRSWAGLLWISPWLIGFLAFLLFPAAMSLYDSFTEHGPLESPLWIGLANYQRMLHDQVFHRALLNTVIYAAALIPLSIISAVVLAALLNTPRLRASNLFQAAIFLPTLVPLIASTMVWMWLFNGEYGLINRLLRVVGINGPNWLYDRHWAMPALIIIGLWSVGQATILCLTALREVPASLYEAADLDGMGPVRRFWNVTVPMISPVILFNTIILTIGAFQVFVVPYVIFIRDKGGPGQTGYLYTQYLYDNAFIYQQTGYANALAWVQLLIILALTGLMFLASKRIVFYRGA
jgi:multiple sugar transport system permease protein